MAKPAATALSEAAIVRTVEAEKRTRQALRELDREGAAISFASVASRAKVSRTFLYEHADFRREIERLRESSATVPSRLPIRERSSEGSLQTRLRAALEESRAQREQIARLREELALAHGRVRELEIERRVRKP
ncbi:MAG: DUF6262 family protein [Solirubrobacteraceae bacterium]|jgi:hypothetical protein